MFRRKSYTLTQIHQIYSPSAVNGSRLDKTIGKFDRLMAKFTGLTQYSLISLSLSGHDMEY